MDEPRARFEARVESLLEQIDKRLVDVGQRMSSVENHMTSVENRVMGLETRINSMETRFENRLLSIENRLDQKASAWVVSFWGATIMGWTSIIVGTGVAIIKLWP